MEYSPRVLPWRDWDEWSETSRLLFAADGAHRQLGVDRVQAWRARGRIPVAVDATAALLEVALVESAPGARSAQELRGMYSMVIIRAINGLVEGQQTKFYAEPVNVLAGRLGLPQWLVDLRHEATHSQLPSLSSLRMGAQQLLDWLFREYWQKQAMDLAQSFAAAQRLLAGYRAVALKAQEESPNALSRACKEEPGAAAVRTASDALLAQSLDGLLDAVSPSFLTAFLLPALVHYPDPGTDTHDGNGGGAAAANGGEGGTESESGPFFLLPDHHFAAAATTTAPNGSGSADAGGEAGRLAWARHRQLYAPLLVRLQRRYPGFAPALDRRLALGGGPGAAEAPTNGAVSYGRWRAHLRTRDWHSHFGYGRGEALFALRRAPGVRFNLRDKPPENWTQPEVEFMLGPASAASVGEGLGLVAAVVDGEGRGEGGQGEEGEGKDDDWALCEEWRACPLGSEL